jgi:hypothetical protein
MGMTRYGGGFSFAVHPEAEPYAVLDLLQSAEIG